MMLLLAPLSLQALGWECQWPGPEFPGGVPCGCPPGQKETGPHMRIMGMIDDRSQATRALQREWVNAPLVLDMRWPAGNATTSQQGQGHAPGEMITPEQVGWGMAGMVMFDGHTLPSGVQPLVFDRTTHGLTPNWQNVTDTFALALAPFLKNLTVDSIMVGDEIVCSGTPFELLDTVISYLRRAVGDEVLIYTNECNDVLDAWPYIPHGEPTLCVRFRSGQNRALAHRPRLYLGGLLHRPHERTRAGLVPRREHVVVLPLPRAQEDVRQLGDGHRPTDDAA